MTEIPEHLLKRSQAAKAKASGDTSASAEATTPAATASVPAVAPTAAVAAAPAPVAPVGPPPPKPDSPVVAAYKRRKKIPVWAMMTLSILPLWAFMYVRAVTPTAKKISGPLGIGAQVFSGCASCHGSAGEGGVGYPFAQGEVLKTFPNIEDQLRFVYNGTAQFESAGIPIYGNPDRAGGAHIAGARGVMPSQGAKYGGSLTEAQILSVVCHERYTLGGADATGGYAAEYAKWCAPDSEIFLGLESGTLTFDNIADKVKDTLVIGTVPLAGSAPI